jgi:hypothetical protein
VHDNVSLVPLEKRHSRTSKPFVFPQPSEPKFLKRVLTICGNAELDAHAKAMEVTVSAAPEGSEAVRGHPTSSITQKGGVVGGSIKEEHEEQEEQEQQEEVQEEEPAMESGKAEDHGGEDGREGIDGRGRGRERRRAERDVSPVPWDEWTRDVAAILSPGVFVCVCARALERLVGLLSLCVSQYSM